jgi:hypothetical protein
VNDPIDVRNRRSVVIVDDLDDPEAFWHEVRSPRWRSGRKSTRVHVSVRREVDGVHVVHMPRYDLDVDDVALMLDEHARLPGRVTVMTVMVERD